jgi:outer membrane protein
MKNLRIPRVAAHARIHALCLALSVAAAFSPGVVRAGHLPLWELGIGVGALNTPPYRGSADEVSFALPFPYAIYRGSVLQVDREDGVRGELFESERLRFDLSLAGNVPVRDTDQGARSGMPGLDPLVEIGAEATVSLWRAAGRGNEFSFVVPFRMVYSVGDPLLAFQGLTLSPYLNYRIRVEDEASLTRYNISVGPIFASNRYHEYFYEVTPDFATPERPAYEASGGYSGSRITLSATRYFHDFTIGAWARYDSLDGAVFADSPLVETNDYFIFGVVFAWILGRSDTMVEH